MNKNKIEIIIAAVFVALIIIAVVLLFLYQSPKGFIYQTF